MVSSRYTYTPEDVSKVAKARGAYLRVHFKNTRETAMAVQGMKLNAASKYLDAVKEHKRCIPFRRFKGSIGRTGQAKEFGMTTGRWPEKSVKFVQDLLQNAKSNAEAKNLNVDELVIKHVQVNQAPKQRRRTYRAHGRIGPYLSHPCHIEIVCVPEAKQVKKAPEPANAIQKRRVTAAKKRLLTA